jgi:hypothetical protein
MVLLRQVVEDRESAKSGPFEPLVYLFTIVALSSEAGVVAYHKTREKSFGEPRIWETSLCQSDSHENRRKDHIVIVIFHEPFQASERQRRRVILSELNPNGKILWNFSGWNCHISVPSAWTPAQKGTVVAVQTGPLW